jgi:hypothetical protein
MEFGKKLS